MTKLANVTMLVFMLALVLGTVTIAAATVLRRLNEAARFRPASRDGRPRPSM